ncbi:hypothetical protein L0O88_20250 [Bacteroides nordii]|nr:hypothetical protein [Bacteroides nordii]
MFPIRRNLFSRTATVILPGLPGCVWPLASCMGQANTLGILSVSVQMDSKKEKPSENP